MQNSKFKITTNKSSFPPRGSAKCASGEGGRSEKRDLRKLRSVGRIFNLSNFPNFPKLLISYIYSFIKTNNQKAIATIRKGINFVPAEVKNTTKYECARC